MRFSPKNYPILNDVGDKGVLLSHGAQLTLSELGEDEKIIEETFGAFITQVINDCKKGYYLSNTINKILTEDITVQEKLSSLVQELQPTEGILLLPNSGPHKVFNSIAYSLGNNEYTDYKLAFSFCFYSLRGLEFFVTGGFEGKKFKSIGLFAKDLTFYGNKDQTIERLINYALNILLFKQFAEIETVVTEGKKSKGSSKIKINHEKYLNESPIPIEIIDSNWFRKLIRTGAFNVSGHFRLQPYGTNLSLRKLIWINEFEKKGYIRKPTKEIREDDV